MIVVAGIGIGAVFILRNNSEPEKEDIAVSQINEGLKEGKKETSAGSLPKETKANEVLTRETGNAVSIPEGYTTLPAYVGEEMSLYDCMRGMLVMSANDCAKAIGEHIAGSVSAFAEMMNARAAELGCENSHFVTPYGGFDGDHYSTAWDMYLITKAAFSNPLIAELAHTHDCFLDATNYSGERYIYSKNQLYDPESWYYDENVIASKSGNLDTGRCLVTRAQKDGADLYVICMESAEYMGVFDDTDALLNYFYENIDAGELLESMTEPETTEPETQADTEPETTEPETTTEESTEEPITEEQSPQTTEALTAETISTEILSTETEETYSTFTEESRAEDRVTSEAGNGSGPVIILISLICAVLIAVIIIITVIIIRRRR